MRLSDVTPHYRRPTTCREIAAIRPWTSLWPGSDAGPLPGHCGWRGRAAVTQIAIRAWRPHVGRAAMSGLMYHKPLQLYCVSYYAGWASKPGYHATPASSSVMFARGSTHVAAPRLIAARGMP